MKNLLIKMLIDNNCIKFGSYNLKKWRISKYYFDIRQI